MSATGSQPRGELLLVDGKGRLFGIPGIAPTSESWDRLDGAFQLDIEVSASGANVLLVSEARGSSIGLFDIRQKQPMGTIPNAVELSDLQSLMLSQDHRCVLQINKDGRFFLYDVQKSKKILNGVYLDDEWVMYTDEGFYDATLEGGHFVSWFYPGLREHFDFSQFESVFKRPELIQAILSGKSPESPAVKPTPPPRVTLAVHEDLTETSERSFSLNAQTEAQDSMIQTVRVFLNGEPIKEIPIGARKGQVSTEIPLLSGLNRVTAVAYDEKGFSSNSRYADVLCTSVEAPKPDLYVLTVGISQYPKLPKDWQLSYAHTDALNLATAFKAQEGRVYGSVRTRTLTNEDATPSNILAELKTLGTAAKKDLVVVLLAGHGIRSEDGSFYFLTPNGDINNPKTGDGVLSWENLGQLLENIQGKVILLLDACHSGGVTTETVVPNDDLAKRFFSKGQGGVTVLTASKGRQVSMESPDVGGGYGVFTYGIVQALKDKAAEADTDGNGFVEWLELVSNVSAFVHNETRGEQTPWLARSEIFGDFPIAIGQRRVVDKTPLKMQSTALSAKPESKSLPDPPKASPSRTENPLPGSQPLPAGSKQGAPNPTAQPQPTSASSASGKWRDPIIGMEFVWVPAGCFQMGCGPWTGSCNDDEKPVHEVCVDGFWMGKTEVTQQQWNKVIGTASDAATTKSNYPVDWISWHEAQQFVQQLGSLNGGQYQFRLPTEAEWEYACRSGGKPEIYAGGKDLDKLAWYRGKGNSQGEVHPVATKTPNGLGLYDMSGNVAEWCEDTFSKDAYLKHLRSNPLITSGGASRVVRGGGASFSARGERCAIRYNNFDASGKYGELGFRVLRMP